MTTSMKKHCFFVLAENI